ncbi:hypothetical protein [Phocaeicola sartorii]|uniref:hypothetical protein n=1 Tax=uncultured Bacteroides sp. TaxID=162156 RepID=UPI00259131AB|nr:hypothetical protein [Phocaeicola sartorii]
MIQQTSTAKMMQANYSDTATLFAAAVQPYLQQQCNKFAAAVQQACSSSATSLQ